jgi:hypothetical protein
VKYQHPSGPGEKLRRCEQCQTWSHCDKQLVSDATFSRPLPHIVSTLNGGLWSVAHTLHTQEGWGVPFRTDGRTDGHIKCARTGEALEALRASGFSPGITIVRCVRMGRVRAELPFHPLTERTHVKPQKCILSVDTTFCTVVFAHTVWSVHIVCVR